MTPATDLPPVPGDDDLRRLAEVALAATLGELPSEGDDDRLTRRVRTVVDAIRDAGRT